MQIYVNDKRIDIRICSTHDNEEIQKNVSWIDEENNEQKTRISMNVPKIFMATSLSPSVVAGFYRRSTILGLDQLDHQHLCNAKESIDQNNFSLE